jgi:hypothetical protein
MRRSFGSRGAGSGAAVAAVGASLLIMGKMVDHDGESKLKLR